MQNQMHNPYTFKRDAWHCKFFKWCYGVEPHKKFPTMCPYFWAMIGTILLTITGIIPILKLLGVPAATIANAATSAVDACEKFSAARRAKKYQKQAEKEKQKLKQAYNLYCKFSNNKNLENATAFVNAVKEYDVSLWETAKVQIPITSYVTEQECLNLYDRMTRDYNNAKDIISREESRIQEKRDKMIASMKDSFKENKDNPWIKYPVYVLAIAVSIFATGSLLFLLYQLALVVWKWRLIFGGVAIGGISFVLLITGIQKAWSCWGDAIGDFFNSVGRGLLAIISMFAILLYILYIFVFIWKAMVIVWGMIKAVYNEYCPIITWVKSE